jgi:predicted MFS family arabinose efflux permease
MTEPVVNTPAPSSIARLRRHPSVPAQLADRMSCFDPVASYDQDQGLTVWSIALGSFTLVFSEVIPVGPLPNVSRGFRISIGLAGPMVVVPAVAAIAAPLLTHRSSRIERRALRALSVVVRVSNVVAATAPGFGVMIIAPAALGPCIGGPTRQDGR